MKRLTLILTFVLLLCLALATTVLAQDEVDKEENIAPKAQATCSSTRWSISPYSLIDGNRSTGTSSEQQARYTSFYVDFDKEYIFSRLIVVTNGTGTYPNAPDAFNWPNGSNNSFWFEVFMYDANGTRIFNGQYQTNNHENENHEVIIEFPDLKRAKKIELKIDNSYDNKRGFWELEAYEHKCKFDTIKEVYMAPTCLNNGNGMFSCKCGAENHDIIPAIGYHDLDRENPKILYEKGLLSTGEGRNCCKYCDTFYEPYDVRPVFDFLGYSSSYSNGAICVGFAINDKELEAYETANSVSLKYGAIISTIKTDKYIDKNATVVAPSTVRKEAQDLDTLRFDITLKASNWDAIADYELVMCAYVIDGESIYYLTGEERVDTIPATITYNKIKNPQKEEAPTT